MISVDLRHSPALRPTLVLCKRIDVVFSFLSFPALLRGGPRSVQHGPESSEGIRRRWWMADSKPTRGPSTLDPAFVIYPWRAGYYLRRHIPIPYVLLFGRASCCKCKAVCSKRSRLQSNVEVLLEELDLAALDYADDL